jgi:hypothetical protein
MGRRRAMPRAEVERHLVLAAKSGKSLATYARGHGVAKHVLYGARAAMSAPRSAFVRVEQSPSVPASPVAIRLPNGVELSLPAVADISSLLRTLAAL